MIEYNAAISLSIKARELAKAGGLSPNEVYQAACGAATARGITLGHTKNALDKRAERDKAKQNPLPPIPTTFEEAIEWMPEDLKKTLDGDDWMPYQGSPFI